MPHSAGLYRRRFRQRRRRSTDITFSQPRKSSPRTLFLKGTSPTTNPTPRTSPLFFVSTVYTPYIYRIRADSHSRTSRFQIFKPAPRYDAYTHGTAPARGARTHARNARPTKRPSQPTGPLPAYSAPNARARARARTREPTSFLTAERRQATRQRTRAGSCCRCCASRRAGVSRRTVARRLKRPGDHERPTRTDPARRARTIPRWRRERPPTDRTYRGGTAESPAGPRANAETSSTSVDRSMYRARSIKRARHVSIDIERFESLNRRIREKNLNFAFCDER